MFEDRQAANDAIRSLLVGGIPEDRIRPVALPAASGEQSLPAVLKADSGKNGDQEVRKGGVIGAAVGGIGGLLGAPKEIGLTTEIANSYLEGLRQRETLIAVQADGPDIGRVRELLEQPTDSSRDENPAGTAVFPGN